MFIPENDYQILKLTNDFYNDYPNPPYKEILEKRRRAYNCLLFQTHYDYFICIPYRSEINHEYAYHFKSSQRAKIHKSGLDYTKIIIIKDTKYLDNKTAIIDKDEFKETVINFERIKQEALKYVEDYIGYIKKENNMHMREFERRYTFSTLKYFHKELEI
ncbi:MAG: hypothetical protein IJ053_02705 [Lachnospiraceae bacterium]|nr:hypothetical protein [Lachnospiraceae bacterium]MBR1816750.1 hypothetical protein [Lachnospiraceae bacterium]